MGADNAPPTLPAPETSSSPPLPSSPSSLPAQAQSHGSGMLDRGPGGSPRPLEKGLSLRPNKHVGKKLTR